MKQRHLNALLLALAGSLLAPAAAQAHEIWLARIHGLDRMKCNIFYAL